MLYDIVSLSFRQRRDDLPQMDPFMYWEYALIPSWPIIVQPLQESALSAPCYSLWHLLPAAVVPVHPN
jgi:hypothetical protein